MSTPNQSSAFPTFLQYWKNLIYPKRRVVPITPRKPASTGKKKKAAESSCVLEGTLALSTSGTYAVNDQDFAIDASTLVFGELKIGLNAKVVCNVNGTRRRAVRITIAA